MLVYNVTSDKKILKEARAKAPVVIQEMFETFLGDNTVYTPKKTISREIFDVGNTYGNYNRYSGNQLIEFTRGNLLISMSNIAVIRGSTRGGGALVTVFEGMFVSVKLNNSVSDSITIESYQKKNNKAISKNPDKVLLENFEFEEIFDVYSKNQILARQILTLEVQEQLVEFDKQTEIYKNEGFSYRNSDVAAKGTKTGKLVSFINTTDKLVDKANSRGANSTVNLKIEGQQLTMGIRGMQILDNVVNPFSTVNDYISIYISPYEKIERIMKGFEIIISNIEKMDIDNKF
ncbi:MAG: DUF3137 domain-containing protein [Oscillospiraceae bacterium]|nr:DUF3137 domain-containing protein [Oscillospiraceae bacterium]